MAAYVTHFGRVGGAVAIGASSSTWMPRRARAAGAEDTMGFATVAAARVRPVPACAVTAGIDSEESSSHQPESSADDTAEAGGRPLGADAGGVPDREVSALTRARDSSGSVAPQGSASGTRR